MFGDIRLETARLLNQAGVITNEQFQAVQAEAARQEDIQSARLGLANTKAVKRFRALPWWKRIWRNEYEWVRRHRDL